MLVRLTFAKYLFVGGLNQLAKNLACEWAKDNIRSNSVAPWVIKTPLADETVRLLSLCMIALDHEVGHIYFIGLLSLLISGSR